MIGQFIKSLMKLIENDIISLNIYSKFFFNFDNAKNDIDSSILKVFFNHEEMKREIKDKPSYLIYYELCWIFDRLSDNYSNKYFCYMQLKERSKEKVIVDEHLKEVLVEMEKLLNSIWEIDKFIGVDSFKYLKFNEDASSYDIDFDFDEVDLIFDNLVKEKKKKFEGNEKKFKNYIELIKKSKILIFINWKEISKLFEELKIWTLMEPQQEEFNKIIGPHLMFIFNEWRKKWVKKMINKSMLIVIK